MHECKRTAKHGRTTLNYEVNFFGSQNYYEHLCFKGVEDDLQVEIQNALVQPSGSKGVKTRNSGIPHADFYFGLQYLRRL